MKRVNNKYIFILGLVLGLIISVTTVYAVESYIESNKVTYNNHNKENVQEAIDELYERSGIHQEEWQDPTLKESGNYPILQDNLIPVEIKPNGDTYYASTKSEWYNYSEKRWANAVILVDNPSNENYKVGDKIEEDDIKGYFVWIPRYSYKIWNEGKYTTTMTLTNLTNTKETSTAETALWRITGNSTRIIDIKFVDTDTTETGSTVDTYLTHPAFKLGNKVLSGIWVGKFETGGTSASDMVVKPNVSSWRNATVKTFFDAGKSFANSLDSHMMKNTEWGAVAYLSHSQYGIGTEVNINNANDYITGYSAAPNTNQSTYPSDSAEHTNGTKTQPWNTTIGYLASTTGNISGIYDMSGGTLEYMAAYRLNGSTEFGGFSADEITKQISAGYIDGYAAGSAMTTYNNRILGDATGELGPFYVYLENDGTNVIHSSWYSDNSRFPIPSLPWFHRGGFWGEGVAAGQFYFDMFSGESRFNISFRLVLAVQ